MLTETSRKLDNLRGMKSGRPQLAVSTTGKYFAPRILAGFVKLHPDIEVSLQIHNRATLIERMSQNMDDLYIFANPPEEIEAVTQVILPNPMVAYAYADHHLVKQRKIPFSRFSSEPFLIREAGSGTRMIASKIFQDNGYTPKIRMELSTNEAIKQAIIAGLGVSIMSRYTLGLDMSHEKLAVLDVEGLPIERNWVFAYPVGKQLSIIAQGFMDFTRKTAKTLIFDHLSKP